MCRVEDLGGGVSVQQAIYEINEGNGAKLGFRVQNFDFRVSGLLGPELPSTTGCGSQSESSCPAPPRRPAAILRPPAPCRTALGGKRG
jgi:hypothetical protein